MSYLVANTEDRFSRDEADLQFYIIFENLHVLPLVLDK